MGPTSWWPIMVPQPVNPNCCLTCSKKRRLFSCVRTREPLFFSNYIHKETRTPLLCSGHTVLGPLYYTIILFVNAQLIGTKIGENGRLT